MKLDVSPLDAIARPVAAKVHAPASGATAPVAPPQGLAGVLADAVILDVAVPAAPPPEVMRDVDRALRIVEWLREHGRELRFRVDEDTRRVQVEVRDLNGRLLCEVPPSEALDAMSGGPFEGRKVGG